MFVCTLSIFWFMFCTYCWMTHFFHKSYLHSSLEKILINLLQIRNAILIFYCRWYLILILDNANKTKMPFTMYEKMTTWWLPNNWHCLTKTPIYLNLIFTIFQFKISSLMNWIFSLFQTWILQATTGRKIQFKLGKKSSS